MTRVLFRKWLPDVAPDETVIALFPDDIWSMNYSWVNSFEHLGQHGSASMSHVLAQTVPATAEEYGPLQRELQGHPYNYELEVISDASQC